MRLWHLLHKVLTETTSVQPIMLSYPQPNSMLYSQGINRNILVLVDFQNNYYSVSYWIIY